MEQKQTGEPLKVEENGPKNAPSREKNEKKNSYAKQ